MIFLVHTFIFSENNSIHVNEIPYDFLHKALGVWDPEFAQNDEGTINELSWGKASNVSGVSIIIDFNISGKHENNTLEIQSEIAPYIIENIDQLNSNTFELSIYQEDQQISGKIILHAENSMNIWFETEEQYKKSSLGENLKNVPPYGSRAYNNGGFLTGTKNLFYRRSNPIFGTINDSRVRIRNTPDLNGEQVGILDKNQEIYILEKTEDEMTIGNMQSVWYKIKTLDGLTGWTYGSFIDLDMYTADVSFSDMNGRFTIGRYDDGIISNVKMKFKSETDRIINIDEIEPVSLVQEILDNPIQNRIDIKMPQNNFNGSYYGDIDEILDLFELKILPTDRMKIDDLENNQYVILKTKNYDIVLFKDYVFFLYIFEYHDYDQKFNFTIDVGESRKYISEYFGKPTRYLSDQSVWVYESFETCRQIAIYFEDDIVSKIQFVSWWGL